MKVTKSNNQHQPESFEGTSFKTSQPEYTGTKDFKALKEPRQEKNHLEIKSPVFFTG